MYLISIFFIFLLIFSFAFLFPLSSKRSLFMLPKQNFQQKYTQTHKTDLEYVLYIYVTYSIHRQYTYRHTFTANKFIAFAFIWKEVVKGHACMCVFLCVWEFFTFFYQFSLKGNNVQYSSYHQFLYVDEYMLCNFLLGVWYCIDNTPTLSIINL